MTKKKTSNAHERIPNSSLLWELLMGPSGGVAVMLQQDIPCQAIHLQMTLQGKTEDRLDTTLHCCIHLLSTTKFQHKCFGRSRSIASSIPTPGRLRWLASPLGGHCATLEEGPWSPCSHE